MSQQPLTPYNNPEAIAARADDLYQRGDCNSAVDLLLAASETIAGDGRIPKKLAELLLDSDRCADALEVIEQIPGADTDYDALRLRGFCEAGLGELQRAGRSADRLRQLDRNRPAAYHLRGLIAHSAGDMQSAEASLQRAVEIDPHCGGAYRWLGAIKKDRDDPAAALDFFERGFVCAPTDRDLVLAYHNEIVAQSAVGRAEKIFSDAIGRHPFNQRLRYLYIDILLRARKRQQAMNAIEDCLRDFGPDEGLLQAALQVRAQLADSVHTGRGRRGGRISLCMIARDEERFLAGCLAAVRRLVDEMILVDTGSQDNTVLIARAFGAKVYELPWQDDFAAARNFSLSKAAGDWVLIMDADEIISAEDCGRLRALLRDPGQEAVAYSIMTRNYTMQANLVGWTANDGSYPREEAGNGWYPSIKVRLFPNDRRIRFSYPIHELVEPSLKTIGIDIRRCQVPVHHYGKLDARRNEEKAACYYELGSSKLDELGDNPVALREMAVQAGALEKHAAAADLWRRLISFQPDSAEAHVNLGTACWNMGDYARAARYAGKAVALAPGLKEAHFNLGLARLYLGDCSRAIESLEGVLKNNRSYLAARFMLACAYACANRPGRAGEGFREVRRSLTDVEFETAVAEVLARLKKAGLYRFVENLRSSSRQPRQPAPA